tara:strand:- start:84 stop:302 length:219 start_codon:yes stop_codon:yes gene_type:complete
VSQKNKITLAEEAKKYASRKQTNKTMKPLTSRRYLAGQALAGLLSGNRGAVVMSDVKRTAYDWADFMLEDDD